MAGAPSRAVGEDQAIGSPSVRICCPSRVGGAGGEFPTPRHRHRSVLASVARVYERPVVDGRVSAARAARRKRVRQGCGGRQNGRRVCATRVGRRRSGRLRRDCTSRSTAGPCRCTSTHILTCTCAACIVTQSEVCFAPQTKIAHVDSNRARYMHAAHSSLLDCADWRSVCLSAFESAP